MAVLIVIGGLVCALVLLTSTLLWRRRYGAAVSPVERENEASANFQPSANPADPACPRCHARGVSGWPPKECPLCHGRRHVRFGPEPEPG